MDKLKAYVTCSAVLLLLFLFGGLMYAAVREDAPVTVETAGQTAPLHKDMVIVIDAGHGGEDSGAVDNGLLEKDINLRIAQKLKDMLTCSGYQVVMTRDSDRSIYDSTAGTIREKKVSDLHNRVKLMNADDNRIVVSIHQNKFEQSQYWGTQIFYSPQHPQSEKLAASIRQSVVGLLQPDNKRELKKADNQIFILANAKNPAVIVECGFLSNPEEAARLSDDAYCQQMAFAVYGGIVSYLNTRQ